VRCQNGLDRIFYRAIRRCVVARRAQRSREIADRIAFMADGGIVEYGPPKKVLDIPRVERTRGFLRRSAGACRAGLRAGADGASHDAEGPVGFHRAHAFADRLGDALFTTHRWSSRPSPFSLPADSEGSRPRK